MDNLIELKGEGKKYEIEDILEMLGGYDYFDYEQIQYVYHKLNKDEEQADFYLKICLDKVIKLKKLLQKMDDSEQKANLEKKIESLENTNVDK